MPRFLRTGRERDNKEGESETEKTEDLRATIKNRAFIALHNLKNH
jgi:hypothetical protein